MTQKSAIFLKKGRTPDKAHANLDGLKDDEISRQGFYGRTAQLYRRNDPTAFRAPGKLRPRHVDLNQVHPSDEADANGHPVRLFYNDDCSLFLSRRSQASDFYERSGDGDLMIFVHQGQGKIETEFGPLSYEPGDYIVLPKTCIYKIIPEKDVSLFLHLETKGELQIPDFGIMGRHGPIDPTHIQVPEPLAQEGDGRAEYEVRIRYMGQYHSIFYPDHPCDVEGWQGDLFPFRFNIRDYNPFFSDRMHAVPTLSRFLEAPGVMVVNFLPRPVETEEGVERVPWYHRNADYDEIAFMHGGKFLGVPLPAGQISHAPTALHHGFPEAARERARNTINKFDRVEWEIIAIDTEKPLIPDDSITAFDL